MTKTRADAGIPRLTPRDREMLELLADLRCMWEPDVAVLLGRLSGRGPVSASAVRSALRRWDKLQLVGAQKLYAGEPRLVWLKTAGARMADEQHWTEPGWAIMRHTAEVARIRLWLDKRGIAGQAVVRWTSERVWRRLYAQEIRAGAHVPDGVAQMADGTVYALEVELSDKGPKRSMEIALALTRQFDQVIYFVPAGTQTARSVRGALERAVDERRVAIGEGTVHVLEVPERGEQ